LGLDVGSFKGRGYVKVSMSWNYRLLEEAGIAAMTTDRLNIEMSDNKFSTIRIIKSLILK